MFPPLRASHEEVDDTWIFPSWKPRSQVERPTKMDNTIQPRTRGEEGKPQEDSKSGGRRFSEMDEKEFEGNGVSGKDTKSPDQGNKIEETKEVPRILRYKNPKELKPKKNQKKCKPIKYQEDFKCVIIR